MRKAFIQIICALPAIQAFAWSVLSGVVGTLLLAGFFSLIMSLELLSVLLPLVVAVNATISGYMLLERAEDEIVHTGATSAAVGIVMAILSFLAINGFCYQWGGFILMSGLQAIISAGMAAIGAWSAGILAIKYRKLKEQSASG